MAQDIQAVVFDWGDTLMRDFPEYQGAMVHWPEVALVPGAMAALQALWGSRVLAVASNAGDSDAELMGLALERAGIRHFFDHLWTSRELGAHAATAAARPVYGHRAPRKPERAFFQAILQRLELEPAGCLMVGNDYQKDIVPAKAVGMKTIWLARPPVTEALRLRSPRLPSERHEDMRSGQAGEATAADGVIRTLDELPAAIDALCRHDAKPGEGTKGSSQQR